MKLCTQKKSCIVPLEDAVRVIQEKIHNVIDYQEGRMHV